MAAEETDAATDATHNKQEDPQPAETAEDEAPETPAEVVPISNPKDVERKQPRLGVCPPSFLDRRRW
jgi:hypothetical protein